MPKITQQKLEAIREACIRYNPSIKDLVFGCKIVHEWEHDGKLVSITLIYCFTESGGILNTVAEHDGGRYFIGENIGFKIIGRDIQLADVLMMFSGQEDPKVDSIDCVGRFERVHKDRIEVLDCKWNLLLPLHLQEESTISFIYELIK
jgi:hypothetical protein